MTIPIDELRRLHAAVKTTRGVDAVDAQRRLYVEVYKVLPALLDAAEQLAAITQTTPRTIPSLAQVQEMHTAGQAAPWVTLHPDDFQKLLDAAAENEQLRKTLLLCNRDMRVADLLGEQLDAMEAERDSLSTTCVELSKDRDRLRIEAADSAAERDRLKAEVADLTRQRNVPLVEALKVITDDWLNSGLCCHQTTMDLRNAAERMLEAVAVIHELAPWASAGIGDSKVCPELQALFERVLEIDIKLTGGPMAGRLCPECGSDETCHTAGRPEAITRVCTACGNVFETNA